MDLNIYNNRLGTWLLVAEGCIVTESTRIGDFWEIELEPIFERIASDSIVIEVGSYIGSHTVLLARKCKKVYSFEGNTRNYRQLCANLLLNDCDNVDSYNLCVGAEEGKAILKHPPVGWSAACTVFKVNELGDTPVYTLDNQLSFLDRLDWLKTDCEGMDLEVLMGAKNLITKFRPTIIYERNGTATKYSEEEHAAWLNGMGYSNVQIGSYNWLAEPR